MAAEEFPITTQVEETQFFSVKAPALKKMVERTAFAMSQEDNRAVLNGLHFSLLEKKLTLVATDGRRMALCDTQVEAASGDGQGIMPAKTVGELRKLTPAEGEVKVYWEGRKVLFQMDGPGGAKLQADHKLWKGSTRLINVVPVELKHTLTLAREEFLNVGACSADDEREKPCRETGFLGQNQLTISAKSMEVREAQETLVMNHEGPELSISFNPTFW
jgi:DNA polymerase-3 subunit beta